MFQTFGFKAMDGIEEPGLESAPNDYGCSYSAGGGWAL